MIEVQGLSQRKQQVCEHILLKALRKGEIIKRPERFTDDALSAFDNTMPLAIQMLDDVGIPWPLQDRLLSYVNNADDQRIWEKLHSDQLSNIVQEELNECMGACEQAIQCSSKPNRSNQMV